MFFLCYLCRSTNTTMSWQGTGPTRILISHRNISLRLYRHHEPCYGPGYSICCPRTCPLHPPCLIGLCHYYLQPKQKRSTNGCSRLSGFPVALSLNGGTLVQARQRRRSTLIDTLILGLFEFLASTVSSRTTTILRGQLDVDAYREFTKHLANVVRYIQEVPRGIDILGPVGGGAPRGNMWCYHDAGTTFSSIDGLNA